MKLVEIAYKDFREISEREENYFSNGVIFSKSDKNVVGFLEFIPRLTDIFRCFLVEREKEEVCEYV